MYDVDTARRHFPIFDSPGPVRFFENAGGSFPCQETLSTLNDFYLHTKVQPYGPFRISEQAGEAMDHSYVRWAQALRVHVNEVIFGPSTSMNAYVLAHALQGLMGKGDEVIVTNQDHEANTGAIRRVALEVGATVREWQVDRQSGELDPTRFFDLLASNTKLVVFPHCSNIVGAENPVADLCRAARNVGAFTVVDGVSFAPHTLPDISKLGADAYLFSLYKTFSVHQGLMVLREPLASQLPNQGHYFNNDDPRKRLAPAGPDHAQVAAAAGVLDFVSHMSPDPHADLGTACELVGQAWRFHEASLVTQVLDWIATRPDIRLIGPWEMPGNLHRAPTISICVEGRPSSQIAHALAERGIMAGSGDFYARRLLEALGIDPTDGVLRLSMVHYTSEDDVGAALEALDSVL